MRLLMICLAAALAVSAAGGDGLNGEWQSAANGETVTIRQQGDTIQIAETGKAASEIQCRTDGQACKIKGGEVMMWYNGPMLVVMETTHGNSRVIKKRFRLSEDGKTLEEEVLRITPEGASEKWTLARRSAS
ncbi:MAG TPA: hypothetical protein VKX45_06365 [Bryobacteraceae bacterium]|nr:hypothetical protein [Bryobacteraceae bacterium]